MRPRIGLVDADDPRVREAAARLADGAHELAPVLIGGDALDPSLGVEQLSPPPGVQAVDHLASLVARGELDAGVGGSVTTSAEMLRTGLRRLRGDGLVCGCFLIRDRLAWRSYADCVVVPVPDAPQLAQIAASAADHHRRVFDEEPRVAMLSFSTAGSATHPRVSHVQQATELLRGSRPDLAVVGEVQFDVAVDPVVAARKAPGSDVAGSANVLVFPSLEAANIAYKVAERVGGATALGSFVLGLSRPWVDLSRGCSADDIVATVNLLARSVRHESAAGPLAG
jgi:phosphate acetyltransferase